MQPLVDGQTLTKHQYEELRSNATSPTELRCVGCGGPLPSSAHGRKWCSSACRHRAARNGGAVLASKPRKRTGRYEPPRKRTGQTSGAPVADVATNGTQPEAAHEGNGASTFSIDRLLDAIGADVASVTVTTRSGIEVVVQLAVAGVKAGSGHAHLPPWLAERNESTSSP